MCHLIYCSTSILLISIFYTDIWTFSLVKQLENKPNELLWQAYAFDFMVLGAVHKWHHQFFEIFLPPQLPTYPGLCNPFYYIGLWSNVTFWQIFPSHPEWVMSFMDSPLWNFYIRICSI